MLAAVLGECVWVGTPFGGKGGVEGLYSTCGRGRENRSGTANKDGRMEGRQFGEGRKGSGEQSGTVRDGESSQGWREQSRAERVQSGAVSEAGKNGWLSMMHSTSFCFP